MNRQAPPGYNGGTAAGSGIAAYQAIDIGYLFLILRSNARVIVLAGLGAMALMFAALQFVPPVYTANARVILDTREERAAPVEEVVAGLNVTNAVIAGEVVTIRSNVLLGQVADRLNLLEHPAFDPRLPQREAPLAWLKRKIRGGLPSHEIAAALPQETLRSWVVDDLRGGLGVSQIGVSFAISITYDNSDPALAAAVANMVADQYIASQLDNKMAATLRANSWLSDRLVELSAQVQEADRAVVDFKAGMIDAAEGSEDSINQLLAELNSRLVASAADRADAEVRLSQVTALQASGGLAAVADVVTSPLLEALTRQITGLQSEQAEFASTLGRKHPEMIRISAQIADLQRSIGTELRRRVEEMRGDVIVTGNREQALRSQIATVSKRAESLSKASVRLSQLERSADATRLVYENFLARHKETSAQADFQTPEARVIGRADVPSVPSGPRKTLFMLTAGVFGLAAAVAAVFLRNLLRAPVMTSDEVTALTGRPVLAMLPHVRSLGPRYSWLRRELSGHGRGHYTERVRTIRTGLQPVLKGRRTPVIVVTSSVPAEGKSSLCCTLAKTLADPGARVLLIDADLRRPDIRRILALPSSGACLAAYLRRDGRMRDLVQQDLLTGCDVISPAAAAPDAADLLSSNRLTGLLKRMSTQYDAVIVNAPPVLHLADALLLAKQADATLFTVRAGSTPGKVMADSAARLEAAGTTPAGVVMTRVRRKDAAAREIDLYAQGY